MGFTPDGYGLAEFLTSEEMRLHLEGRANRAADYARAMSPVGPEGDPHRGDYKAAWRVETDIKQGEPRAFDPNRRARATVINDVDYAASVEFGNHRGMDGQYVLTRAIDAMKE